MLAAAGDKLEHRRFILLAVFTGMRHQEIMKLHWDEVDMDRKVIQLSGERTKNNSPRKIPMHELVFDTLSDTPSTHREGFVFKTRVRKNRKDGEAPAQWNFTRRWEKIRERAGMPTLRIHDLRHTFASWLKQSDVAESTIMELMGHKTRSMTERYSHDSTKSLRRAVAKIDRNTLSDTLHDDFRDRLKCDRLSRHLAGCKI
ncbi:site-specific integrase [Mesorhizobium sp. WSM2239]|uniref:Site-specific integrase n=2 Tax=unclassified Mesorhizobium TaxID=325217 RepID=A0AAU8DF03_9HYPH